MHAKRHDKAKPWCLFQTGKRGQVTTFMIVGIVIVLGIALILSLRTGVTEEKLEEQEPVSAVQIGDSVQSFVHSCIKTTAEDAVVYVSARGGYYDLPGTYDPEFQLPFYFYEELDLSPTESKVEEELASYIDDMLFSCLEDFTIFKERGFDIEQGNTKSQVSIQENKVDIFVTLPLYVTRDAFGKELVLFETSIPSNLNEITTFNQQFLDNQVETPTDLCVSCIVRTAQEEDLTVTLYQVDNRTILFDIFSNQDDATVFSFLNQYPEEDDEA